MKLFLILIMISIALCSCGKSDQKEASPSVIETAVEPPIPNDDSGSTNAGANQRSEIVEKVATIVKEIKSNRISAKNGLGEVGDFLDDDDLNINSNGTGQTATSRNNDLEQIVDMIAGIQSVNATDKLAYILKIDLSNVPSDVEQLKIERIFYQLGNYKLEEIGLATELFILNYTVKVWLVQTNNDSKGLITREIVSFYRKLFRKSSVDRDILFKRYSILSEVFKIQEFYDLFKAFLPKLKIFKEDSKAVHVAYGTLIKKFNKTYFKIVDQDEYNLSNKLTKTFFDSLLNHASWTVKVGLDLPAISNTPLSMSEGIESIDNILNLFDVRPEDTTLEKSAWIKLLDSRVEIMNQFASAIKKISISQHKNVKANLPTHPYAITYVYRALMKAGRNDKLLRKITTDYSNKSGREQLQLFNSHLRKFLPQNNNKYQLNAVFGLIDRGESDTTKIKQYRRYFYKIEFTRLYLELMAYLYRDGVTQKVSRSDVYHDNNNSDNLVDDLIKALNIRFDKAVKYRDLFGQNTKKHLHDLNDEFYDKDSGVVYHNKICTLNKLNAGIYIVNNASAKEIRIDCPNSELSFSPLAMIYTPEATLTLSFKKLSNPWIDVSARKSNKATRLVRQVNVGYHCTLSASLYHYIGGGANVPFDLYKRTCTLRAVPKVTSKGFVKRKGGNVNIYLLPNQADSYRGIPLIVVNGGDGSDGADGYNSASCDGNSYSPANKNYTECKILIHTIPKKWTVMKNHSFFIKLCTPERFTHHSRRGRGGDGGPGGSPGLFSVPRYAVKDYFNVVRAPGKGGNGGLGGVCGDPSFSRKQASGRNGSNGSL